MQVVVFVALAGSYIAFRKHRKAVPLIFSVVSAAAIIYGINTTIDTSYIYGGLLGLSIVSVWNSVESPAMQAVLWGISYGN